MLLPPPEIFRNFADRDLVAGLHRRFGCAWKGNAARLSVCHAKRQFAIHPGPKRPAARREPAREKSRWWHRVPPARIAANSGLWPGNRLSYRFGPGGCSCVPPPFVCACVPSPKGAPAMRETDAERRHPKTGEPQSGLSGARQFPSSPEAGGLATRLAARRLREAGVAVEPLRKKAGLSTAQIDTPDVPVSVESQIAFLDLAAKALRDDFLGFRLALDCDLRQIATRPPPSRPPSRRPSPRSPSRSTPTRGWRAS